MRSTEPIDCKTLSPGSLIDVETASRHYRIEWLGEKSVRLSGHPQYCPYPVPAHLEGAVGEDGVFDQGHIGRGMRLVFLLLEEHRPITTSKVLSVEVEAGASNVPATSSTIH